MVKPVPERWKDISNLFGAYLNQDFPDEYGSPEDTVLAFKGETSQETVSRTADQAHDLARSTRDEGELRKLMLDLGIEYMPWAEGWSSHAWLEHLEALLRG